MIWQALDTFAKLFGQLQQGQLSFGTLGHSRHQVFFGQLLVVVTKSLPQDPVATPITSQQGWVSVNTQLAQ